MTNVTLIAILLAVFAFAIGLVRVLGAMIEGGGDSVEVAEEPADASGLVGYPYSR